MKTIRPVVVVGTCGRGRCRHQRADHIDARYSPDDISHHSGPCKFCSCHSYVDESGRGIDLSRTDTSHLSVPVIIETYAERLCHAYPDDRLEIIEERDVLLAWYAEHAVAAVRAGIEGES